MSLQLFINIVRKKENRKASIDEAFKTNIWNAATIFKRNLYLIYSKQLHCFLHDQTKKCLLISCNKASVFLYFTFWYPNINLSQTSSILRNTSGKFDFHILLKHKIKKTVTVVSITALVIIDQLNELHVSDEVLMKIRKRNHWNSDK